MNPGEQLPVPQDIVPLIGLLDKGIVLFRDAQDIELDQSPDLNCVRVLESRLRQDYELVELGAAAPLAILALGEHKFVISGSSLFERTFRLYRKANTFIRIESWDDVTWSTEFDGLNWVIDAILLSWKTYFAEAFFADGSRVIRWSQVASIVAQSDEFASSNSLTVVGNTVDATITPAAAYLEKYAIHYNLTLTGPCVSGSSVEIEILRGSTSIVVISHPIPASNVTNRSYTLPHEIANIVAAITSGQTLTLKLKAITAVGVERTNELVDAGSGTPQWSVTKTPDRESDGDVYTFKFSVSDNSTNLGTFVEFYYDTGAGWVLWDNSVEYFAGQNFSRSLTRAGLGSGDKFGIHIKAADQEDFALFGDVEVTWDDSFAEGVAVHGFNLASDSDASQGVVYNTEGSPTNDIAELDKDPSVTPSDSGTASAGGTRTMTDSGESWSNNEHVGRFVKFTSGTGSGQLPRKITANTSEVLTVGEDWLTEPDNTSVYEIYVPVLLNARYLGIFADRLIALQEDGDPQKIAWSVSGDPADMVGSGSGTTIRDSRSSDPVDELMALEPLSANIAILFRRRSLERVTQTGVVANALGFFPWLQNFGTESPFSVTAVPGGIIFLGHDKQVYYLTESGPIPLSTFIQEELEATIGDLSVVEGEYDPTTQEYILAVPGLSGSNTAVVWRLDFGRLASQQVTVWQKRTEVMNRLSIIAGRDIIFVGSDGVVRQFDKTTPCTNAFWVSPMLNREKRGAEYTLSKVTLKYEAEAATTIVIEASDDGGSTWSTGFKSTVDLAATTGEIRRAIQGFNITGYDLRFRITYPTGVIVDIHNWRADLVARGDLGSE